MFVGHLAMALGAKTVAPRVPLGWLVAASFALDLLWPVLLLTGVGHVRIDPENGVTPRAFDSYPWELSDHGRSQHRCITVLLGIALISFLVEHLPAVDAINVFQPCS